MKFDPKSAADQGKALLEPAQKLSRLGVETLEKLARLQQASLQTYTGIGLEQMKAATEVTDPEAFRAHAAKQGEILQELANRMMADAQAIAAIGAEFGATAQQIGQDAASKLIPKK